MSQPVATAISNATVSNYIGGHWQAGSGDDTRHHRSVDRRAELGKPGVDRQTTSPAPSKPRAPLSTPGPTRRSTSASPSARAFATW